MDENINQKTLYNRLTEARKTLGIGKEATVDEIKAAFRELILERHPDKVGNSSSENNKRAHQIIEAYRVIMDYCNKYKISFSKENVNKYRSEQEFWLERFGNDPMWGPGG